MHTRDEIGHAIRRAEAIAEAVSARIGYRVIVDRDVMRDAFTFTHTGTEADVVLTTDALLSDVPDVVYVDDMAHTLAVAAEEANAVHRARVAGLRSVILDNTPPDADGG